MSGLELLPEQHARSMCMGAQSPLPAYCCCWHAGTVPNVTVGYRSCMQVKQCLRTDHHNWKHCPWRHPGETAAQRRHPSVHKPTFCINLKMVRVQPHVISVPLLYSLHVCSDTFLHCFSAACLHADTGAAVSGNAQAFTDCAVPTALPTSIQRYRHPISILASL
jgi:hypothetical protein